MIDHTVSPFTPAPVKKMPYLNRSLFVLVPILMIGFAVPFARAQENMPSLDITSRPADVGQSARPAPAIRPVFNYPNDYLNDTLRLQYQNVLLEKMIQRQSTISRTEKSFITVGVPFDQPPPPYGICEQIPVNVPCFKAYPDLYPDAVPEVGQIEDGALEDPVMEKAVIKKEPKPEPKSEPVASAPPPTHAMEAYSWAEIMCAGGQCEAVLVKDGQRRTVRAGDSLADGISVSQITATGVSLIKDGSTQTLSAAPAPSRGGMASPKYAAPAQQARRANKGYETRKDLESAFSKKQEAQPGSSKQAASTVTPSPAPAVESASDMPSAPMSDPGPPLGPTGLY